MANTVVEQIYGRVYSKGISLSVNFSAPPAPNADGTANTSAINAWLSSFTVVAGVRSIAGPSLGRDVLDMNELDLVPLAPVAGDNTYEMYWTKPKAPGDKESQPLSAMLNMTTGQFEQLYRAYMRDLVFGIMIRFPSGALTICLGFVESLEPTIESSKIIEVACELQPSFGVDYLSTCASDGVLHGFWQNYLSGGLCTTAP